MPRVIQTEADRGVVGGAAPEGHMEEGSGLGDGGDGAGGCRRSPEPVASPGVKDQDRCGAGAAGLPARG